MPFSVEVDMTVAAQVEARRAPQRGNELALRVPSRAGAARRSRPLTAPAKPIRSRAWGWLRPFAASPRTRPAARTPPPSGAGLGVGETHPFGSPTSRPIVSTSTRNGIEPILRVDAARQAALQCVEQLAQDFVDLAGHCQRVSGLL